MTIPGIRDIGAPAPRRRLGIKHNRHALEMRRSLHQKLHLLARHLSFNVNKPCDVAARSRKARDKASTYWIGNYKETALH
jgi:hypothetical protein